jgi:hypothetical protein
MKRRRSLYARPVIVRGEQCAEARLERGSDTKQLPGRCRGYGGAGSVPIAEPSLVASSQAPHHRRNGSAVQRASSWLRGRECPNVAAPFVALSGVRCPCPVSVSGVRCPGVRCPRVWCPVCGPPVSTRLVSIQSALGWGSWSEPVRRRQRPAVRTGQLRRGRPPCPRAAQSSARVGLARSQPAKVVLGWGGSRPRTWPPSWDALGRRLRPRSTAWPTRDSRLRARVARQLAGDHGRGAGWARHSPMCCIGCVPVVVHAARGRMAGMRPTMRWLDRGGDYGAWSL